MRRRRRRLDRQRLVRRRGPGPAQPRRLRGEQGRHQRAHDPAGRGARARPDPGQRLRSRSDERAAQPRRRSVVPRDLGAADPARPDCGAGGHGRPDGVSRLGRVLARHRPAVLRRRRLDLGRQGSRGVRRPRGTPAAARALTPPLPLRRNRDFVLLLTGRLLSTLGSQVTAIAYPLLVLAVTHSPAKAGIVGFAGLVPHAALRPARGRRRRPLEPQAADDRGRRRPSARDRDPGGDDPPRPGRRSGRSRSSRSSRARARSSSTPLTPARSAPSSPRSSCPRPWASIRARGRRR